MKYIWDCCLQNIDHFIKASACWGLILRLLLFSGLNMLQMQQILAAASAAATALQNNPGEYICRHPVMCPSILDWWVNTQEIGPWFNIQIILYGIRIPIVKIRWWWNCLIFWLGIPLLIRQNLYIETLPKISVHKKAYVSLVWTHEILC